MQEGHQQVVAITTEFNLGWVASYLSMNFLYTPLVCIMLFLSPLPGSFKEEHSSWKSPKGKIFHTCRCFYRYPLILPYLEFRTMPLSSHLWILWYSLLNRVRRDGSMNEEELCCPDMTGPELLG